MEIETAVRVMKIIQNKKEISSKLKVQITEVYSGNEKEFQKIIPEIDEETNPILKKYVLFRWNYDDDDDENLFSY